MSEEADRKYQEELMRKVKEAFEGKDAQKNWDECLAEEEAELKKLEQERERQGIADVIVPEIPFSDI